VNIKDGWFCYACGERTRLAMLQDKHTQTTFGACAGCLRKALEAIESQPAEPAPVMREKGPATTERARRYPPLPPIVNVPGKKLSLTERMQQSKFSRVMAMVLARKEKTDG
jgi:hypothetical protein